MRTTMTVKLLAICVALLSVAALAADEYAVQRMKFKVSYVEHGEKLARGSAESTAGHDSAIGDDMFIQTSDMLQASVSAVDSSGDAVSIEQAMLRIVNLRTGVDNLYVMRRTGSDAKVEVNLKREIRADRDMWTFNNEADDAGWRVEVIVGDANLKNSRTWVAAKRLRIKDKDADVLKESERGVFDFDISVKRSLLPEFEFPLPKVETRAKPGVILLALAAVIIPLPMLLMAWTKMGALPLRLPQSGKHLMVVTGLQVCIIGHVIALAMFWLRWNIVTTWKVMGAIMVPTLMLMRAFVNSEGEEDEER